MVFGKKCVMTVKVTTVIADSSVVFDTSALLLFLDPEARPPQDPNTGKPIARAHDRTKCLIERLRSNEEQILIPTPALAEVLVYSGEATESYLKIMEEQSVFRIVAYDKISARECARLQAEWLRRIREDPTDVPTLESTRARLKIDREIIAISSVNGARAIYTDDKRMGGFVELERSFGNLALEVIRTTDLPPPDENVSFQ